MAADEEKAAEHVARGTKLRKLAGEAMAQIGTSSPKRSGRGPWANRTKNSPAGSCQCRSVVDLRALCWTTFVTSQDYSGSSCAIACVMSGSESAYRSGPRNAGGERPILRAGKIPVVLSLRKGKTICNGSRRERRYQFIERWISGSKA